MAKDSLAQNSAHTTENVFFRFSIFTLQMSHGDVTLFVLQGDEGKQELPFFVQAELVVTAVPCIQFSNNRRHKQQQNAQTHRIRG